MWVAIVLLIGFQSTSGTNLTDAEYHRLPRLFELDDYEECLAQPGALYCMGTFRLSPMDKHSEYDVLKIYSSNKRSFNRTLLHRGYCVSTRCSDLHYNSSLLADRAKRFEECVQKWTRPLKLISNLETLNYCRGPEERPLEIKQAQEDKSIHQLFMKISYSILLMNVVGTVYDVMLGHNRKGHKLLMAWSIRNNWHRLVEIKADKTALPAVQGYRAKCQLAVLMVHAFLIHFLLYTKNPLYLENILENPICMVLKNGTAVVQVFMMLSSFWLSYNLLNCKEKPLNFSRLPKIIVRRIARISPVYYYVLLFSISWWPLLHDGPMWQLLVGKESNICKSQFWSHIFFINNYSDSRCLIQTWSIAVDMQLYIFGVIVTLAIAQLKLKPLPILGAMFVAACAFNVVMSYIFRWKQFTHIVIPESSRKLFVDEPSYYGMYTSTWGSLPASILGLYVAHKHYYEQVEGKIIQHSKIIYFIMTTVTPLTFAWWSGHYFLMGNNPIMTAICTGLEKLVFSLLGAVFLYGICKGVDSPESRVMSWRGFDVLSRLSLSVLLIHWFINMHIAIQPTLFYTSVFRMATDTIGTWVLSHCYALPLTLLLEMPMYRSISAIY